VRKSLGKDETAEGAENTEMEKENLFSPSFLRVLGALCGLILSAYNGSW
jgi:hypothetical protein